MGNTGTFCARKPSKQEPKKPELDIIVHKGKGTQILSTGLGGILNIIGYEARKRKESKLT